MNALDFVPLFSFQYPALRFMQPHRITAFLATFSNYPQPKVKRGRGGRRNRKNRGGA